MKKIYTMLALLAAGSSVFAQKASVIANPVTPLYHGILDASRAPMDTLWWTNTAAAPSFYTVTGNGGYVVGSNKYGDKQKAEAFVNTYGTIGVTGTLIWVGAKKGVGSGTSKVQVKEYDMTGTGTSVASATAAAPGTVHASLDVLYTAIDTTSTGSINVFTFTTPVITALDFAVGMDFTTLAAGDSVGLVSSADGDGMGADMSWEQWSTNDWHTFLEPGNWGIDFDIAIWPIIDLGAGVQEHGFVNGVKLSQNQPNPATNNTVISYELQNTTDNVSLKIFDATGKLVATYTEGNKTAGKYSINVATSNLDAGIYYYALSAGKGRMAQKMVISK